MADRITAEHLDLLAETDPLRLRDEAIALLTKVEQLRTELTEWHAEVYERREELARRLRWVLGRPWEELFDRVDGVQADRSRFAAQVKRVRDLHAEHVHSGTCRHCWLAWPCPTRVALDGEPGAVGPDDLEGRLAKASATCGHCDRPLTQVDGTWLHKATCHEECHPDTEPVICAAPELPF